MSSPTDPRSEPEPPMTSSLSSSPDDIRRRLGEVPVPRGSADVGEPRLRIKFVDCRDHPSSEVVLRDTISRKLCYHPRGSKEK